MGSEQAALRGMLAAGERLLEVAGAQQPALPPHILAAIEETCTDLRARLIELSAGPHDTCQLGTGVSARTQPKCRPD